VWTNWNIFLFSKQNFQIKSVEGGELFDKVVELGQYDEKTAKLLFFQMVQAIKVIKKNFVKQNPLVFILNRKFQNHY
jgi:hypothetical protein